MRRRRAVGLFVVVPAVIGVGMVIEAVVAPDALHRWLALALLAAAIALLVLGLRVIRRSSRRPAVRPDTVLDREGRSVVHYAALENRSDDLRRLIAAGADVNRPDRSGATPLHFAAQQHAIGAMGVLIANGAELEMTDADGNTPLMRATLRTNDDGRAIEILRAAGADPWHRNNRGVTPVSLARRVTNFDIARWYADLGDSPRS